MKLKQMITFAMITLAISMTACMDKKNNKSLIMADEKETEIHTKKEYLKGLTKATENNFSDEKIMLDGESIAVYDADGNRLKGLKLFNIMSSGDYMPEFYVDEKNEVKTVVLRAATKDEKEEMEISKKFEELDEPKIDDMMNKDDMMKKDMITK